MTPEPKGYSAVQIGLHWLVAVLILLQFVLHDSISAAWRAIRRGQEAGFDPLVAQHVLGGIAIFALVVWRIALRRRRGVPPLPKEESPALQLVAKATHAGLYLMMLALPISGAAAWFGGVGAAAEAHEVGKAILLLLVALHVVGALYHQFVLRDGIMQRMRRPSV